MILTGPEIDREYRADRIHLSPYSSRQLNPNSYNYRLGSELKVYTGFDGRSATFESVEIPPDGYVLQPGQMYLGHTAERIGSTHYAMSLIGRSSIGRLGLFVQLSADLGHTTSLHCWTLELFACLPVRVYPRMKIGQVSFWSNKGEVVARPGRYAMFDVPHEHLPEEQAS